MPNNIVKVLLIVLFSLGIFSCSNVKSTYDYNVKVDFRSLKTYQWDAQPAATFTQANPLIAARLKKAIEENLQRKGLVTAKAADIKISYQMRFDKKLSSSNISGGFGISGGHASRGSISISSGSSIREITEATLLIDMVSTSSSKLIWRSTTTKPISGRDATPQESEKRIGQLIYRIFDNFPPPQK